MNLRLSLAGAGVCLRGHPWIASAAQLSYRRPPAPGTLLKVQDSQGDFLGWALSEGPGREPAFRMLSRERHAEFGDVWWGGVVERALARRGGPGFGGQALRVLDSEADGVPGLRCEACAGQFFLSLESTALEPFLPLIEKALAEQTRTKGLWRRFAEAKGGWGPWHRSPLAPLSPARFEARDAGLSLGLDLGATPGAQVPPWPVERRSWRAWAKEACAGRDVLALGPWDGEAEAAQAALPRRFERIVEGFASGAALEFGFKPDRLLVDLPVRSNTPFGRFDAAKHAPKFLKSLRTLAADGAQWLLSSAHPSLAGAEAWAHAWKQAEVEATLVRVLGPEPDCPEIPRFPEGRRPRAFVFET